MRGLAFAFVASCILWCLLTWCTVCACSFAGTMTADLFDLLASLAIMGLCIIVICLAVTSFGDGEPENLVGDYVAD